MQAKGEKIEIVPELMEYASDTVKNNCTCREVRKWLEKHNHSIQSFLVALTMIKKGNLADESYQEVSQEFLAKFKIEIIKNWSPRFQSAPPQTPLYQAALGSLETNKMQEEVAPSTLSFI